MKSKKKRNFEWERQYRRRQEKINGFARKYLCPGGNDDAFVLLHPDEYRRYLQKGPCIGCPVSHLCDTPCRVYFNWYNTRMKLFRALLGQEDAYAGTR